MMRMISTRAPAGRLREAAGVGSEVTPREARALAEAIAARVIQEPRILPGLAGGGLPLVRVMSTAALRALRDRARAEGLRDVERVAMIGLQEDLERRAAMRARALALARGQTVDLQDTGAPSRRAARRWRTADGGHPHAMASPVPPGPAPRPVGVGRVQCIAVVPIQGKGRPTS